MRIGIISRHAETPATVAMIKAVTAAHHDPVIINPDKIHDPTAYPAVDSLIVRFSPASQQKVMDICRYYENLGVPATTTSESIRLASDKILSHKALAQADVKTPATYELSPESYEKNLSGMSYPVIIKLPRSSQGAGVMIAESLRSARSITDALFSLGEKLLVQEFIEAGATDIRIIVIDGVIVTAMKRSAQKRDEFRSNLSAGGMGEVYQPTPMESETAIAAAQALGCVVAGVDIVRRSDGTPLVLEVNASPGLAIEEITGIDIVKHYITLLESLVTSKQ